MTLCNDIEQLFSGGPSTEKTPGHFSKRELDLGGRGLYDEKVKFAYKNTVDIRAQLVFPKAVDMYSQ
jgi:hypothetical protein